MSRTAREAIRQRARDLYHTGELCRTCFVCNTDLLDRPHEHQCEAPATCRCAISEHYT